jgi:4-amino-4-deoxy-L-arabinose transferase-like glycosyltransferase
MSEIPERLIEALSARAWAERAGRLRGFRFDDGEGLPAAPLVFVRAGNACAWIATLFIALVGLWEIAGPFAAGHYASTTAIAVGGENMLRWGILAPVPTYIGGPPAPSDYYCHHPFGVFWTAAAFSWLFGHHDWVCRLPAVLMSACLPRLVHGAGRALYGPIAGGLAALAYVVLPITLAYANFFSLEIATMFGMALAIYGFARFSQCARYRFGVLAVVGFGYAAAADWPGFFFDGLVLGALFLRGFVVTRPFGAFVFDRFAKVWAWSVVVVTLLALFHLAALVKLEHVSELLRQGDFRTAGSDAPLATVLEHRRYWIELAFTPLAVVIGKLGLPVLLARLVFRRRELELFPLALLATASVQYVVFKQGADIHFFWPEYFALYFAYAVGALVASLDGWFAWAAARRSLAPRRTLVTWVVGAVGLASVLAILPDGLVALIYARQSGGRFNERGSFIHSDFDKEAALASVARGLPTEAVFGVSNSFQPSYWMDWVLERPVRYVGLPRVGSAGVSNFALDTRFDTHGALESLTREFPVRAIGPFLFADSVGAPALVSGFATVPRRLGAFARFFTATSHDVYDVVPDPFWTWELRAHLNQTPNPAPSANPVRFEELRIAHNLALFEGDQTRAERLRAELLADVDRSVQRKYTEGVELLGARLERGASTYFTLYFETNAPLPSDVSFQILSTVEAAPRFSLTPRDELIWDVGVPFALPTTLWRPGFIYSSVTEITRRPGVERYDGGFRGPMAPTLMGGPAPKPLLRLP